MKKVILLMLVLAVAFSGVSTFASQGTKGASEKAMHNASDEAIFHRVGDWFATRGKSDAEKNAIIAERKAKRAAKRAQKKAAKKSKMMEKEAQKKQKRLQAKMDRMKKGSGK